MAKRKPNRITVILIAVGLTLGLAVWSIVPGSFVNQLLGPAAEVLVPVQQAAGNLRDRVSNVFDSISASVEIQEENEQLRAEIAELRQIISRLEGENLKYQELKEALQIQENYDHYEVLHANVTSQAFGSWFDVFRIDIGQEQDIILSEDQISYPVVDSDMNLIGRILMSDSRSSSVLPFINEGSVVSAKINQIDGALLRVYGDSSLKGSGLAMVDQVPETADIQVGDELITSGSGGFYPLGLPIGVITEVHEEEGRVWAYMEPYVEFIGLSDVFVLKGQIVE